MFPTILGIARQVSGRHSTRRAVKSCGRMSARTMQKTEPYKNRIEILQGTLDMLILRTLQWGPQHGHGIGQMIRASSEDLLRVEHGSLYPALHRLEEQGWIAAEWRASDLNRRAKYYRLTAAGKRQLAAEQSKWNLLVKTIARVMRPA
jgi:PadR family transcriptional regulator PadR